MSSETRIVEANQQTDTPQSSSAQPAAAPLCEVLSNIRCDSQQDSSQYLEETVVPKGGE